MNSHGDDKPVRPSGEEPPARRPLLERIGAAHWSMWAVALSVLYVAGAEWSLDQNVDVVAAALPGWQLVTKGSLDLQPYLDLNPWIVETPTGAFSNRPLGLILAAAAAFLPAQLFTESFTTVPTTILSIGATVTAVALVATIVRNTHGGRAAGFVVVALGLGTATWPISASQMWPHGLDQMYLAIAMWAFTNDRPGVAATAGALMAATRPPLAVVPVVVLAYVTLKERRVGHASVAGALGAFAGLAGVLLFNARVFGDASLSGGYGDFLTNGTNYRTPSGYISNLAGTLFDPLHGVLLWSMWLVPSLLGVFWLWKHLPNFVKAYALAGLAYLLVHTALNRYWGGLAFNYRYSIEPLTVAAPALAAGWTATRSRLPQLSRVLVATLVFSVVLHGTDALLSGCEISDESPTTCRLIDLR